MSLILLEKIYASIMREREKADQLKSFVDTTRSKTTF